MIGDPSQDAHDIYKMHMREKRKAGLDAAPDPLVGRSVALDVPCRQCGSTPALVAAAPKPHAAALHCADCGKHRQWIARSDYAAIKDFAIEIATRFGDLGAISFRGAIQRQDNQEATDMQKKAAFDNSNSGVLFKNDNKQSDKHADYRGEVNAAGVDYWLNGYVRTSKKGGLPVFPVRLCKDACLRCDVCKKSACLHGFKDATTDPDTIRQLWRMYPGELIGIPTGATSGFDVLDIDTARHPEAREWWIAHREYIPRTRLHLTGSGGLHGSHRQRQTWDRRRCQGERRLHRVVAYLRSRDLARRATCALAGMAARRATA